MKIHDFTTVFACLVMGFTGGFVSGCGQIEHGNVAIAISPDGKHIVFSAADDDLYLFSIDTRRVTQLTKTGFTESTPTFSPDGNAIVYASTVEGHKGSRLFLRKLDGKQVKQLTGDADVSDSMPSYSPDGNEIAFVRAHRYRPYSMGGFTWDNFDVYVMGRDGSNLRRVTSHDYYQAGSPSFIESGKTLVFSASGDYPDTLTYLFSVPADGSRKPRLLTAPPPVTSGFAVWGGGPSASADGKRITFISDRRNPFQYDVFVMGSEGIDVRPLGLTAISRYNQQPVFLPDGKSIMFLAGTETNASSRPIFSLWKAGIDGSKPLRIADSKLFTDPLHWSDPATRTRPTPPNP